MTNKEEPKTDPTTPATGETNTGDAASGTSKPIGSEGQPVPPFERLNTDLKYILEIEEKLRNRKKELKNLIMKEGNREEDESKYVEELQHLLKTLLAIGDSRNKIYTAAEDNIKNYVPPKKNVAGK